MPWNQQDKSFKILLARRATSSSKAYYEEIGDQTLNFHFNEVWMDPIALDPNVSIASGVVEQRTLLTLVEDASVASQQCYYAFALGERLKDWVGDKYGASYAVRLYQNNGTEIYPTDSSQWIFDYQTGILTFNGSTTGFTKPFKISGFRYVGSKGLEGIPVASATAAGRVYLAENNDPIPLLGPTATRTDDSRLLQYSDGTHIAPKDARVDGSLYVKTLKLLDSTGGLNQYVGSDSASDSLVWKDLPDPKQALVGAEIVDLYDVTSFAPSTFQLSYSPMNSSGVSMHPDGGIDLVNGVDFSVTLPKTVSYLGTTVFDVGDRIVFKYIRQ